MPLNISTQSIVKLNSRRFHFKRKSAANALLSQPVLIEGTKQSESLFQDIFKTLTSFAAHRVKQEYTQSSEYFIFRASARMIYVKRCSYISPPSDPTNTRHYLYYLPKFDRTRKVEIVECSRKFYLTCSCQYYERWGFVCRHQYAVLCLGDNPTRSKPEACDAVVRWHKSYNYFYQNKDYPDFTARFDTLIENEPVGPQVDLCWLDSALSVGEGDKDLGFFERCLHPVFREGYFWSGTEPEMPAASLHRSYLASQQSHVLEQREHLSQAAQSAPHGMDSSFYDEESCLDITMQTAQEPMEDDDKSFPALEVEYGGPIGEVDYGGPVGEVEDGGPVGEVEDSGPVGEVEDGGPVGEVVELSCYIPPLTSKEREHLMKTVFRASTPYSSLKGVVEELTDLCTNPEMYHALKAFLQATGEEMRRRHGTLVLDRRQKSTRIKPPWEK
jgi:hypothetical protein